MKGDASRGDPIRVLIAGGGTGGHLFPGIAVADEVRARMEKAEIRFVVGHGKMDAEIIPRYGYRAERLDIEGLKGRGFRKGFRVLIKLPGSLIQSLSIIRGFRPHVVLGMGAYSAGPLCLMARISGVPTAIHEQNSYPGLTNRMLARYVDRVFISFEESRQYLASEEVVLTGTPVRPEMMLEPGVSPPDTRPFTLLVVGGSQGAKAVNSVLVDSLVYLEQRGRRPHVIHQTGQEDHQRVLQLYREKGLSGEVLPFIDGMAEAYRRAHLVIGRAGASTIFELAALGKPSILIPYPFAANLHQDANARALVQAGAAEAIPQRELTGEKLGQMVLRYMNDPSVLNRMGEQARSLGRPEAAALIVDQLLEMAGRRA